MIQLIDYEIKQNELFPRPRFHDKNQDGWSKVIGIVMIANILLIGSGLRKLSDDLYNRYNDVNLNHGPNTPILTPTQQNIPTVTEPTQQPDGTVLWPPLTKIPKTDDSQQSRVNLWSNSPYRCPHLNSQIEYQRVLYQNRCLYRTNKSGKILETEWIKSPNYITFTPKEISSLLLTNQKTGQPLERTNYYTSVPEIVTQEYIQSHTDMLKLPTLIEAKNNYVKKFGATFVLTNMGEPNNEIEPDNEIDEISGDDGTAGIRQRDRFGARLVDMATDARGRYSVGKDRLSDIFSTHILPSLSLSGDAEFVTELRACPDTPIKIPGPGDDFSGDLILFPLLDMIYLKLRNLEKWKSKTDNHIARSIAFIDTFRECTFKICSLPFIPISTSYMAMKYVLNDTITASYVGCRTQGYQP